MLNLVRLAALLAVAGFGLALWWIRIVLVARDAMKATMVGLSSMTDQSRTDLYNQRLYEEAEELYRELERSSLNSSSS